MKKEVVLVDIFDNEIGREEKLSAHYKPKLHRAFSVFLHNGNKILLQKRAEHKYHSAGLWANACCSHPTTENIVEDAKIRVKEELGIEIFELKEIFSFMYMEKFNENLFEHEFDHVLLGEFDGNPILNPDEASEYIWIDIDTLSEDLIKKPQQFAVWFLICAPKVISFLKNSTFP